MCIFMSYQCKPENIVESKDGKFYLGNSKEAMSDEQLEKHENSLDLYDNKPRDRCMVQCTTHN